jgi:AhpD family alkylhydroperoxidase
MRKRINIARGAIDAYRALAAFNRAVDFEPALRELVKIRASQLNGCAYCSELHRREALEAGESEPRLNALAAWRESLLFSERERAALAVTDAVTKIADRGLPEEVLEQARAHFDERELANLILAIAAINAWNRVAVSSGVALSELGSTARRSESSS